MYFKMSAKKISGDRDMKKKMKQSTLILILNAGSVAALLFMVFSLVCFRNVSDKINKANTERFELTYNANRFMNGSSYLTNEVRAYAATGKQGHYDNYWNEVNNLKNRDIGVENMEKIGLSGKEKELIDEMSELSNGLVPLEEEAMEYVKQGDKESALEYVYGDEYSNSISKINEIKSSFLEMLDERALGEVNRLIGVSMFISFFIYGSVIVVVILQVLTSYFTRKRIIAPIVTIENEMGEISQGNLSAVFPLEPDTSEIGRLTEAIHTTKRELKLYIKDIDDKLAQMAKGNMDLAIGDNYRGEFLSIQDSMRTILEALNRALAEINHSADQVASGSEQVASSAEELSQGAVEQSATVQELSGNMKVLGESLEAMASNAVEARNYSVTASDQLQFSNEKMDELSSAIRKIADASNQISGIIKIIEDIAFQTNILALNAAVEAARAGEAGKGFAVVADEVRNLAAKSSEAAQSTTVLIENMLKQMQQGTTLTTETTEALFKVVEGARLSTDLVDEIATKTNQQLKTLDEVLTGIDTISHVVESNAAAAEESAASAQELSGQAVSLKQSVERFKLRSDDV